MCENAQTFFILLTWNRVRASDWAPLRRAVSHYVGVMGAGWRVVHWCPGTRLLEQSLWNFKEEQMKEEEVQGGGNEREITIQLNNLLSEKEMYSSNLFHSSAGSQTSIRQYCLLTPFVCLFVFQLKLERLMLQ